MPDDKKGKAHKVVLTGTPNSPFKVSLLSDVGAGEPFISRLSLRLSEVLDAMFVQCQEEVEETKKIKRELGELVFECLIPAFLSLRELRQFAGNKEVPELTI